MTRTAPFRGGKSIQASTADEAEQVSRSSLAISREIRGGVSGCHERLKTIDS